MKDDAKAHIRAYLCGPRPYRDGVDLYCKYGHNLMLKRTFSQERNDTTYAILIEELRKLAGLSNADMCRLPRYARQPQVEAAADTHVAVEVQRQTIAPEMKKAVKFREAYPFLSDTTCPNILKIAANDMISAHSRYVEAHAQLHSVADGDIASAATLARQVVEAYIENRELRAELDYYRQYGVLLGEASMMRSQQKPEEDITLLSDLDLSKKRQSARSNVGKRRKALSILEAERKSTAEAEEALKIWSDRLAKIDAEIENRKKKSQTT